MNKKRSMKLAGLLSAAIVGLAGFPSIGLTHTDGAYAHQSSAVASNPDWMKFVDGNKRISELSIPGTHDTMSIKSGAIWQNQTMSLSQQLESGLRVFDMRTRHIDNKFRMHHGIIAQDTYFDDVLKDIDAFLTAHPNETVLFRLRSEHTAENNSRSYTETLDSYLAQNGSKRYTGASDNPTLDEVRGKFVILQEFGGADYGIPYSDLDKQDDYSFTTNWDLYDKWTSVKNHLNKSRTGSSDTIYMNYLSGAGGSFPYFVASGHLTNSTSSNRLSTGFTTPGWKSKYPDFPRTSCFIGICTISFEGTNTLAADHMVSSGFLNNGARAGMVMADFPGKRLIENTIRLNNEGPYTFTEFTWGTGTDQGTPLCNGSSPCVEGDTFASAPPAAKDSLTVVSYNVLRAGADRVNNQIAWLKNKFGEQGPDVILLSETVRGAGCSADVSREYAKAFNAYYVNGNEDAASSCQTGNSIISRYPLGNVQKVRFNTQHGDSSGTKPTDSGRSYVVADLKVGDDIVHVFSTHTASPFGASGDTARKGQHAEIIAHAETKRFTKIVGGDLNAIGHIFADPLGLHDISLNPIFERGYSDAHDNLPTHKRVTSQAGLVDNDWTLLLDFIFVKGGSTSGAGVCDSECRDKNTLSDHVPIWATVSYKANAAAPTDADLATMKAGDQYSFKLNTTDSDGEQCRLEWDGGLEDGERNAKWDCASNGDPMSLQVLTAPTQTSSGHYEVKAKLYTLNGGCGLQWTGGDEDDGERNAKWDCDPSTDDMIITSRSNLSAGRLDKAIITTVGNNCGLQWDAGKSGNERNAKFDCDPAWNTVNFVNVKKIFSGYAPLSNSGHQTAIQSTYGCDSGDSRCNDYLEFGGSDARIGGDLTLWEMLPADNSGNVFFLRNKWNCASDERCDDWLTYAGNGTDVVIDAADAEMVPWAFEPVTGKADTYYIRTRWGCESGDSRCNYYLTFSGSDVVIHPTDKVEWKLPKDYRELRVENSNKCLDISGSTVEERDSVFIYNCAGVDWQKWHYDPFTGLIRNKANPAMCLDHRGKLSNANDEYVHMWTCYDWSTNQKWDFSDGKLQPRGSQGPTLGANGTGNDAAVTLWETHGGANQKWSWGNR
jgi:1-phosphatidylinositol phosphodiesterase